MNDGSSDTHNKKTQDEEEYFCQIANKYGFNVNGTRISVKAFVEKEVFDNYNWRLAIRPGNNNTAVPTYLARPDQTIEVYISNELQKCGKKQLLYWYFKMMLNAQFSKIETDPLLINIENSKITSNASPPEKKDMDEKCLAMRYTKRALKILI